MKACSTCVYSDNGNQSCFRLMSYAVPAIDVSKGKECAGKDYQHYLEYGNDLTDEVIEKTRSPRGFENSTERWIDL